MTYHLDYLLGLPGARVQTCQDLEGAMTFRLEIVAAGMSCPHCQNYTDDLHQTRPILVRDLSAFGRKVYLQVPRRQFYCAPCQRYATEPLEFIDWQRRHTRRYELQIYERVQHSSLEQIGREEELSSDEVKGIFDHISQQKKRVGAGCSHRH